MVLTERPPPPELPESLSAADAVRGAETAAAGHANGSETQRRASPRDRKVRWQFCDSTVTSSVLCICLSMLALERWIVMCVCAQALHSGTRCMAYVCLLRISHLLCWQSTTA